MAEPDEEVGLQKSKVVQPWRWAVRGRVVKYVGEK